MHNTLRIVQQGETPIRVVRRANLAYRYAYARSADTHALGDIGQDYLALREDEQTLVFALCDGVSQSFFGDLAARYLGDRLVEWLWDSVPPTFDVAIAKPALSLYLQDLTRAAKQVVERQPLPPNIAPLLREVLEEKRAGGSESTFVCGRIDMPGSRFPSGRILLAWMGDSRLRAWNKNLECSAELGGVFQTAQRWSTQHGPLNGEPSFSVSAFNQFTSLVAYSDGLSSIDRFGGTPPNAVLQDLIDRTGQSPASDDVVFLEVWLDGAPNNLEAVPLPAPRLLEAAEREGRLRMTWGPVTGATHYEVEIRNGVAHTAQTSEKLWSAPPLPAGEYQVQVRAWRDDQPGFWSEAQPVALTTPTQLERLSAPRVIGQGERAKHAWITWTPVAGATLYEVAWQDDGTHKQRLSDQTWESPPLNEGNYRIQVRALHGDVSSDWSESHSVAIPAPVKEPPSSRQNWRLAAAGALLVIVLAYSGFLALQPGGPWGKLIFPTATSTQSTPRFKEMKEKPMPTPTPTTASSTPESLLSIRQ